jgi:primary-amine oxidase
VSCRKKNAANGVKLTHLFSNYKFDFDIAGTRNSLMAISLENEVVQQPWFDDDWGQDVHQTKIVRTMVRNESDALLDYPKNLEGAYVIVNEEELNRWGYRAFDFRRTIFL